MLGLLALNPLNDVDVVFFIVLAVIVALCIAVYFLIPVINKKQYREQRDNLKKREVAFKSNIRRTDGAQAEVGALSDAVQQEPEAADKPSAEPPQHEEE